mmetsp:Transcript_60968/g.122309  ORF Transcript_60968/g.122309 Transcript_60968/m.122309 type:complete len:113 (+) Transcript_60968:482-820(+)
MSLLALMTACSTRRGHSTTASSTTSHANSRHRLLRPSSGVRTDGCCLPSQLVTLLRGGAWPAPPVNLPLLRPAGQTQAEAYPPAFTPVGATSAVTAAHELESLSARDAAAAV